MARMRTISEAANYIREKDPKTAITAYSIRRKVKSGELPSWRSGVRFLIDLDTLEAYFSNPVSAVKKESEYGMIRRV